jgi:hypothetical protein
VPAAKYTKAQRDEALALYELEGPTAAGKKLGIPKETIMSWAKRSGVHTVRTLRTRDAVEAKVVDAQAKIAAFRLDVLEIARHEAREIREAQQGLKRWKTILKGSGGSEHEVELDFIPPQDKRANSSSLASHAGTIRNTAPQERENTTIAKSMLDRVIEAHGLPVEVPDA